MPIINHFRYRPEIDGLRALAVLAVVFFHTGFGCPGGFIGVDVFFVISGYLITSIIWKDLEEGKFTFAAFWERRARRILPAMVVVTLATLVTGWFVMLPSDFERLGEAAVSQALFAANIYYQREIGYFRPASDETPLLHTWSLAVEEQFYFIVPFLFWGIYRLLSIRSRKSVLTLLLVGCVASIALSIFGVSHHPNATFFFLPTRAWELLLGSVTAFMVVTTANRSLREATTWIGLSMILLSVAFYSKATPFPGLAALPPTLGTALIIWANGRSDSQIPTTLGRLLAWRPFVFIGLISYSLYLWHWPLLAFGHYLVVDSMSFGWRVVLMVSGFILAVLSWWFVETPFRVRKLGATRKSVYSYAAAGIATLLLLGGTMWLFNGFPGRFPPEVSKIDKARLDMPFRKNVSLEKIRDGKLPSIGLKDPKQKPVVLLWGDSHAMAVLPALDELLKERHLSGVVATHSATPPVLGWGDEKDKSFNDAVFSYLQKAGISDVVLIGRWQFYKDNEEASRSFDNSLLETVTRLAKSGVRPWMLFDVPNHTFNVPTELARSLIYNTDLNLICTKPLASNLYDGIDPTILEKIEKAGGRLLDPKPLFLDPAGRFYQIKLGDVVLYRDTDHITGTCALEMVLPFFRENLIIEGNREVKSVRAGSAEP
jgi:peptidoglycan/LPS O-acetylase OafA/YrhL